MAIKQYLSHSKAPEKDVQLATLMEQTYSTRGLLTMLGDYWVNYYKDTQSLAQANSGYVATIGKHLTRVFELIKSGNILDIPPEQFTPFELLMFKRSDCTDHYDADGNLDYIYIPIDDTSINDIEYLTTSLFESAVVLVKDEHYKIVPGDGIYFYVDIFNDAAISTYSYHIGEGADQAVLFWGNQIVLSSYYIYQRFGRFLYKKASDSYQYKWLVTALMRYYAGTKTCNNVRDILDILFGIPYARYDNETILSYTYTDANLTEWWSQYHHEEASFLRIVTDKATYYSYNLSTPLYKVGDTVPKNALFCKFSKVLDYIVAPKWWITDAKAFPDNMFVGDSKKYFTLEQKYDLMDRILKYNTVYLQINIDYDSYSLFKNIIHTIREIIRTGFPVYLNPHVEVDMHTTFLDNSEFETRWANNAWLLQLTGDLTIIDKYFEIFKYDGEHYYNGDYLHRPFLYENGYIGELLVFYTGAVFKDKFCFAKNYDGRYYYEGSIYHTAGSAADRCVINYSWAKPWVTVYNFVNNTHDRVDLVHHHYAVSDKVHSDEDLTLIGIGDLHYWDKYTYRRPLYHDWQFYRNGMFRYDGTSEAMGYDTLTLGGGVYLTDKVRYIHWMYHDSQYQHNALYRYDGIASIEEGAFAEDLLFVGNSQLHLKEGCAKPTESKTLALDYRLSDDTHKVNRIQHNFKHTYDFINRYDGKELFVTDGDLIVTTKIEVIRGAFNAVDKYKWLESIARYAAKLDLGADKLEPEDDSLAVNWVHKLADQAAKYADELDVDNYHWHASDGLAYTPVERFVAHYDNINFAEDVKKMYPVKYDFTYTYGKKIKHNDFGTWAGRMDASVSTNMYDAFTTNYEDEFEIEIHNGY